MHWIVTAPFIDCTNSQDSWLIPYVMGNRHQFTVLPRPKPLGNWHNQSASVTSYREWLIYLQHGYKAVQASQQGVITVFPQLASTVGLHQQFSSRRVPVVAWMFNVGTCFPTMRRWLAQVSLKNIDCFVVHTRRERKMYSEWLRIPEERFEFVPYQVPELPILYEENLKTPFLAAVGSAHRDFSTFFTAVEKLNLPTVVASGRRALAGYTLPPQVQAPLGIGRKDCWKLAQEARLSVVPLMPNERATAAGQATIVEAMRMGRAVIATNCNGVEDYIIHGETGFLVEPQSVESLMNAIDLLWNDSELRHRIARNAQQYAADHFSDEAAGRNLTKILDRVADSFEPEIAAIADT
jgi:hypothetical protein